MRSPASPSKSPAGSWRAVRTPLGTFHVAAVDGCIVHTALPETTRDQFVREVASRFPGVAFVERQSEPVLEAAASQLDEYARGKRQDFDIPLRPSGTQFQRAVWDALATIPYGEVRTYAEVARFVGKPAAFRAVGQANHRNPVAPFIPCHRVIASGGGLGGYGGGLLLKKRMLELEGVHLG
ncbi:MAG: methylated-DNA--[protein]-cysteine S-methyltransferase [Candidatus Thermoplasmatota archaeon]